MEGIQKKNCGICTYGMRNVKPKIPSPFHFDKAWSDFSYILCKVGLCLCGTNSMYLRLFFFAFYVLYRNQAQGGFAFA